MSTDENRFDDVIKYYDSLDDDGWAAEDEAAFNNPNNVVMLIPRELVPAVRTLLLENSKDQIARADSGPRPIIRPECSWRRAYGLR